MAVDRAIDSTEFDSKLTAVADAIRTAGGITETMSFPSGMVEAITAIQAGGGIELNGYQVSEGSFTISSDTSTFPNYSTSDAQWPLVTGTNLTGKNFAFLLFIDPISVILTLKPHVSLLFASASSVDERTAGVSEGVDLRTGFVSGLIGKHKAKGVVLSDKETGTLKIYFGKVAPLQVGTTFHWFLFVEGAA
jgi:hypothetical protein